MTAKDKRRNDKYENLSGDLKTMSVKDIYDLENCFKLSRELETPLVATDKKGRKFEVLGTSEYPSILDVIPKKYGDVKYLAVSIEDITSFHFS